MITAVVLIIVVHCCWVVLVIFGALATRGRLVWSILHIFALLAAIITQTSLAPCPLTLAELHFRGRAGLPPYEGRFLVHYINLYVSSSLSASFITNSGVAICCVSLFLYALRFRRYRLSLRPPLPAETAAAD